MNITEDFCSYEVAKLLKEKGFKEPVTELNKLLFKEGEKPVLKITHQKAMKWLREEKNIIIVVQPEYFNVELICFAFGCDIWCNDNYEKLQGIFPSHEEAVESALNYTLKNLI